jgi:hypothetical protein
MVKSCQEEGEMKKYNYFLFIIAVALCCPLLTQAAVLEIEWVDIKEYRDIQASNQAQKVFEEHVIKNLTGFFRTAAKKHLPDNQTLHIRITDLDLAGDVDYFFMDYDHPVRVVKEMYWPSIEFSYELRDAQNQVIKSGSENIKDMDFLVLGAKSIKSTSFNYEKRLIDNWFKNTFNNIEKS